MSNKYTATSSRGTQQSTVGTTVPQIGRAKSRGFEYVTGSETNDIFATTGVCNPSPQQEAIFIDLLWFVLRPSSSTIFL